MTESVIERAVAIARDILDGRVDPENGSRRIWQLLDEQGKHQELYPFIALATDFEELPDRRGELERDTLAAARDLVARRGGGSASEGAAR